MRRDWDVVKGILERLATAPPDAPLLKADKVGGYDEALVLYHFRIMHEAGLITVDRAPSRRSDGPIFADRMTWEGEELLATLQSNKLWEQIKKVALEKGIELSFSGITVLARLIIGGPPTS